MEHHEKMHFGSFACQTRYTMLVLEGLFRVAVKVASISLGYLLTSTIKV